MKQIPNLPTIGQIVEAWKGCAITTEEAERNINRLMAPQNFIPECEVVREPSSGSKATKALHILERVEIKMNALIRHSEINLPDDVNPQVLLDDVKSLADEKRLIEAVQLHRTRTGMGFAEATKMIRAYLNSKQTHQS